MLFCIWSQLTTTLPKRKDITMQFFIEELVKNNKQMQAHKAEYSAKRKKKTQALSAFLPRVEASLSYNMDEDREPGPMDVLHGRRTGNKTGNFKAHESAHLEVRSNLFNSFGDVAGLKEGKAWGEAAKYKYYKDVSEVFLKALDALLQINVAITKLEVSHLSAEGREKIYSIANNKFRNKAIALGDLKHAESERDTAKHQQYASDAQYQGAIAEFISYSGIPVEYNYMIELPNDLPKTYEEAENLMVKNNFDIQMANYKVDQVQAALLRVKSKFGPRLDFHADGSQKLGEDAAAISEEKKKDRYHITLGVKGTINIFNGFRDISEYQENAEMLTSVRCERQAVLSSTRSALKSAWAVYSNALEQRGLLENAVKGYEIATSSAMIKYESGAKSVADVANAQETLANAKRHYSDNERVLRLNAWRLKILIGDIKSILNKLDPEENS